MNAPPLVRAFELTRDQRKALQSIVDGTELPRRPRVFLAFGDLAAADLIAPVDNNTRRVATEAGLASLGCRRTA